MNLQTLASACLILVGIINSLPALGLLSAGRLESLYGVAAHDANLHILLAHRALVLAMTGGLILVASFELSLRPLAYIFGMLSMLGYVGITLLVGDYNAELRKVMLVDIVAIALMLVAMAIDFGAARSA